LKVLFLLTITDSFGEREHALSFARQITDFQPVFFLHPQLSYFFANTPFECHYSALVDDLKELINKIKPVLIICCEYYHLFEDFRVYLRNLDIPVATMDGTSIGEEINSDPLAFGHGKVNTVPPDVIKLRPCPVNDPSDNSANLIYWNLFPELKKDSEKAFINNYFPERYDKTIFLAISPWAVKASLQINIKHYYNFLFEKLTTILGTFDLKINLIIVSPFQKQLLKRGNVSLNFIGYPDYVTYQKLLLSSGLVISDNLIQTSLSKAFMAGINTLALNNSRPIKSLNLHIFNIFPLKILFPQDREYYRLIEKADLGATNDLVDKIKKGIYSYQNNYLFFRKKTEKLLSPNQIVGNIIS